MALFRRTAPSGKRRNVAEMFFDPKDKFISDILGEGEKPPSRRRLARWELFNTLQPGGPTTQESPTETASLTALEQMAQRLAGGTGPEAETFALGRSTLADVLSQAGPQFEQFFRQGVEEPMLQTFSEKVIPQLDVELARSGFFGTGRERALGGATDRLMRALTQSRAGLQKGLLETRMAGAQLAPELAAPELETLQGLLESGDVRRQKELDRIKLLMSLQGPGGSFSDTGEGSSGRENTGAVIQLLPMLMSMMCWVAEELYGHGVQLGMARLFCLTNLNHPFIRLYQRYGREWAEEIRYNPQLRDRARTIWNYFILRGVQQWLKIR